MTPETQTILIVDDDVTFGDRLARALKARGFDPRVARSSAEALGLARAESPELALVDLRLPGMGGLELVRGLKAIDPETKVVVLTGYGSIATALEAVRLGATHYLTKPADLDEVIRAFDRNGDEKPAVTSSYEVPSLARAEWEHIQKVLTDCEGNISQAARLLGVHRRSLQRKLLKYPVAK